MCFLVFDHGRLGGEMHVLIGITHPFTKILLYFAQKAAMRRSVILKRGKEVALERRHPWIFSGAIHQTDPELVEGGTTDVYDSNVRWLCAGHFHGGSIAVRVLTWNHKDDIDTIDFWLKRLTHALDLRTTMQIISEQTNCFRWIHGEGDGLSGLIIDVYGEVAVIQCHSVGMFKQIELIAQAVLEAGKGRIKAVYNKSKEALPKFLASEMQNGFLIGESESGIVLENGHHFKVDWAKGQKTGFFLDQRDNRALLGQLAKGRSVLNTFCYTGGFSVYAIAGGAKEVVSVDVSSLAIGLTEENVKLNAEENQHTAICADVLEFFKEHDRLYDIVIVDPPAFAKTLEKRHNAVQGYKRLNASALRVLKPGGLLFTFSCSQVVDDILFQNTIVSALLEAGRSAQILHKMGQGADHPVQAFHPEGHYLKGLLLRVE
jgi:23S rRNA (cytosine1962-C5)-methyltransferase